MDGANSAFLELLTEAYMEYVAKTGKRRVSDNEFSRYLGVSASSFNQWINGNRTPDLANAARLARRLGPRVFDVLGFPQIVDADNPDLQYLIRNWDYLDAETQKQIHDHVVEVISGRSSEGPNDKGGAGGT